MLDVDPLVQEYRAFFALFDWSVVDRWLACRSACYGSHHHSLTAYLKAFLLRIREGLIAASQLRDFLCKHPLLIIELSFDLQLDPSANYGFDVEATLPTRYWFGEKLRQLDRTLLTDLLAATVAALKEEVPGLGEVVAFDVRAHLRLGPREQSVRHRLHSLSLPQIEVLLPADLSSVHTAGPVQGAVLQKCVGNTKPHSRSTCAPTV
ncbi:hypothetical protein KSF_112760 [Reticulibacter mediterranei]|uniref:Uncharacterized protein n=1 Tax=Reticulibacter mediterranei TaxID=2778369 RepID=A0A8J3N9W0_9CHLR|nr:hypothetical protein [Reticulibacter mediterranei]GHO97403.1 hypothetical protein KSF_074510 [Reticulibacter mediterranei]GHP01229.1 hypothetical protein KSF_112760 [Reticulibacter mediterranei]